MSGGLPMGKPIYRETHNGMCIHGISYSEDDLNQSAQTIADICFDARGQANFESYMVSISDTGFRQINSNSPKIKDWQVGEGFAEAYLTTRFSCNFPWSNNRDLKNIKSSLAGADLVGFHDGQFAFGEVKTSTEQKYPPQVTLKKDDGLNAQLKKLCLDHDTRWVLIQYLFHRLKGAAEYREACTAYLENSNHFYVFGVLVRDVNAKIDDWNYLKKHLTVHEENHVYLVALYLPNNDGIQKLHTLVLSKGAKS